MTLDAPVPADLRHWLTRHLPGPDTVEDVSWPRGCSRVWRVASGTNEAYVKLIPAEKGYARERTRTSTLSASHPTRFPVYWPRIPTCGPS